MRRVPLLACLVSLAAGLLSIPSLLTPRATRAVGGPDFVHFESGQVHPLAITPDGNRLLVLNTPDNRLSVFDLTGPAPVRIAEIQVGLEPVSVAARSNGEAWVVNNLSDDVSIVDLTTMHVRATLRVGDEPNDIAFAAGRAYVSVSQEDAVKAYDPANLQAAPIVIPIPGRMPRALAASIDGANILVDVFNSGGQATVLSAAEAGDSLPPPNPPKSASLPAAPKVGLVVKKNAAGNWVDQSGKLWNSKIKYDVPMNELVYVSTATNTVLSSRGDIATTMMGLAIDPVSGSAAVTGTFADVGTRMLPTLRGRITEQRMAIVPSRVAPQTRIGLNPHINYNVVPGPQAEGDSALGMPTGVAWSADGQRIFVASMATNRLGVFSAAGALLARVPTIEGPTGVIADPTRGRLYVLGRFHNQIQTLSASTFASVALAGIGFDPTPDPIVNGRKFFYGGFTSGHGDQSCASCHLFGDMDNLVWDLGEPQGSMAPAPPNQADPLLQGFHPMKGPMATQSLRGLPGTGLLHWRGDRADLNAFNGAFVDLMGRAAQLPDSEMQAMSAFVMPLAYPPNPNQFLNRTMPDAPAGKGSAVRGQSFFMNTVVDGPLTCNGCHTVPTGTNGQVIDHFALQESQDIKVPQLRNLYKKTGFKDTLGVVNKRGFGFTHDGAVDNLFNFLKFPGFNFGSQPAADNSRRDVEAFLLAFDTGLAPAVGYQITFDGTNNSNPTLNARLDTLEAQAGAGNCDLIAKGLFGTTRRGWVYEGAGLWKPDVMAGPALTRAELLAQASAGHELTVSGVPAGSGTRMGIDRDRDGFRDGDELDAGTDPGNPASFPTNLAVGPPASGFGFSGARPNPFRVSTEVVFSLGHASRVSLVVYDVLGREVKSIAKGLWLTAGPQHLAWDGRRTDGTSAAAGVYFVRLETDHGRRVAPVVRIR